MSDKNSLSSSTKNTGNDDTGKQQYDSMDLASKLLCDQIVKSNIYSTVMNINSKSNVFTLTQQAIKYAYLQCTTPPAKK